MAAPGGAPQQLLPVDQSLGLVLSSARADEATLAASWPAGATVAQVRALFQGTVVQYTTIGGVVTYHAALPDAIADDGRLVVNQFSPPIPGGPQLDLTITQIQLLLRIH